MRGRFIRASIAASVVLVLGGTVPAIAQMHLRTREEREAAEKKKQAAAAQATPATSTAAAAAECLPDGTTVKPAVNTLEDILVVTGFGLRELTQVPTSQTQASQTKEGQAQTVEWKPVER